MAVEYTFLIDADPYATRSDEENGSVHADSFDTGFPDFLSANIDRMPIVDLNVTDVPNTFCPINP